MPRLRPSVVLALLLLGTASLGEARKSPAHRPRTLSHHLRRKKSPSPAEEAKALRPARWTPEISAELERLLAEKGVQEEHYSAADPPVAAFALEDAAVAGSIAEALFYRLVSRAEFKFSDKFWEQVPAQYGGPRARAAYESFRRLPRASWEKDPYYRMYRKIMFGCQEKIRREWGGKRCAEWRVRLLVGFPEAELRPYVQATIDEELQRPVSVETIEEYPGDESPVKVRTGLRRIPEMEELFDKLKQKGFDVWVLSDAYQWAAEEMAKEYGVHPSRVLAVRSKVTDDGVLTETTLIPVPKGSGRAEALTMFVNRSPVLAVGNDSDAALLDYGPGLRILLVDPEKAGQPAPDGRKWRVQQRFSPEQMPQERRSTTAPGRAETPADATKS